MSKNVNGIYSKKDKTFYYLECGENYISNQIDRVKKALIQRGLITINQETLTDAKEYKVLTLEEAQDQDLNIKPIFLNSFIKENFYKKQENTKRKWS
jgi:hypothetical protein